MSAERSSVGALDPLPDALPREVEERLGEFTGREWVFREIDEWLAESDARSFLVCAGPGTGKSAIAGRLTQFHQGGAPADGYACLGVDFLTYAHFCRAFDPGALDPLRFVEELAKRLAEHSQTYALALTRLGEQKIEIAATQTVGTAESGAEVTAVRIGSIRIGGLSGELAFERLVRGPLTALSPTDLPERIVVLVDGLDEALTLRSEETLITLLGTILVAERLPAQLRFLLTARPDPRILNVLGEPALDLEGGAPTEANDVRAYAYRRLAALPGERREQVAMKVAAAGQGNFLYARFVLDDLTSRDGELDPERLVLPPGLAGIYGGFLERELARSEERWTDRYRPLLSALAVARGNGLTRSQLQGITALAKSRADDALRALNQYVSAETPEGPFRLYHESFRDFLLGSERYSVYPAEGHEAIALFFATAYRDRWAGCTDEYPLLHLRAHVTEALTRRSELTAEAVSHLERVNDELASDADFVAATREADFLERNSRQFVGRKTELRSIDEWLASSLEPVLAIVGSPGTGKTALAAQIIHVTRSTRYSALYPTLATRVFATFFTLGSVLHPREITLQLARKLAARHPDLIPERFSPESLDMHLSAYQLGSVVGSLPIKGGDEITLVVADSLDEVEASLVPLISDWMVGLVSRGSPHFRLLITTRTGGFDPERLPPSRRLDLDAFNLHEMSAYLVSLGIPFDRISQAMDLSAGSPLFARFLAEEFRASPERFDEYLDAVTEGDHRRLLMELVRRRLAVAEPGIRDVLTRVLLTIANAPKTIGNIPEPMTVRAIADALSEPPSRVRAAIAAAGDLIIADGHGRLRLLHLALVEALSDPEVRL